MKTSILLTSIVAISLSACSATTGSIAKNLGKTAVMQSATASTNKTSEIVVMEAPEIDRNMDCAALSAELAAVEAMIEDFNATISGSGTAIIGGKVAATGASQAALHSGASSVIAKVPFGGLFAKKAVDTVANSGEKKVEKAKLELQAANLRKASLTGLYAGKNCAS